MPVSCLTARRPFRCVPLQAGPNPEPAAQHRMQRPASRQATQQLNQRIHVEGLQNLIRRFNRFDDRAIDGRPVIASIVHFSTCYAHGRRTGLIEESALNEDVKAEHSHEQSKREGEFRLSRWQPARVRATAFWPGSTFWPRR